MKTLLFLIQILAICVHTYLLMLERKYCQKCEWWWNPGYWIAFVLSLIPIIGIFTSIAGCADYARNISKMIKESEK